MRTFDHIHIVRKLDSDLNHNDVAVVSVMDWAKTKDIPFSFDGEDYGLPKSAHDRVLFVSIGGDGTMLYTMKLSLETSSSSVVGINRGSLGFLVDDLDTPIEIKAFLDKVDRCETDLDERMVLATEIDIYTQSQTHLAVNEFLFSTGTHNAPFNYKVLINDKVVAEQFGSGVLVSTSTGSTAMSLSAGGAIVGPSTNIIQVVPLVSHSLSARPFITTGRDMVSIVTTATERASDFELRADGRKVWDNIPSSDQTYRFDFNKYPQQVYIHRPKDWNFFEVLTKKLKW